MWDVLWYYQGSESLLSHSAPIHLGNVFPFLTLSQAQWMWLTLTSVHPVSSYFWYSSRYSWRLETVQFGVDRAVFPLYLDDVAFLVSVVYDLWCTSESCDTLTQFEGPLLMQLHNQGKEMSLSWFSVQSFSWPHQSIGLWPKHWDWDFYSWDEVLPQGGWPHFEW